MRKKNNMMCILRKSLSLMLSVFLCVSAFEGVFALDNDLMAQSDRSAILQNLKVSNTEDEKSVFSFSSAYLSSGDTQLNVTVEPTIFESCAEIELFIQDQSVKPAVASFIFTEDELTASFHGLQAGQTYQISAIGENHTMVHSFIGYVTLYEKNEELAVLYKVTHQVYDARSISNRYITSLRKASEMIDNSKGTILSAVDSLELVSANELLIAAAAASIRYESESNNTRGTADVVYDDDTTYGMISYNGDIDYYKVKFDSDGEANFWLGDIPSGKDYDLYLYDESGVLLESSTGTTTQEQIYEFPVEKNVWYYLRVKGIGGAYDNLNYYRIRAKNYPTVIEPDVHEPNDWFSGGTVISSNDMVENATIHNENDSDYFQFTLTAPFNVNLFLCDIPEDCDYDMQLWHMDDEGMLSNVCNLSRGGNDNEEASVLLVAGVYVIRIFSYSGSSGEPYTLVVSTREADYGLTVKSYIDQGYQQRFSNPITSVTGHMNVVDDIFQEGFGLTLYYSTYDYTSLADDCKIQEDGSVTSTNLTELCGHNQEHDLTRDGVVGDFVNDKGQGTSTLARILWTGHILDGNPRPATYTAQNIVIMTPYAIVNHNTYENILGEYQYESRYDLMHELSHVLGAHDHYCKEDGEGEGEEKEDCSNAYCWDCREIVYPAEELMIDRFDIENKEFDEYYCFECILLITEHLSAHH